MCSNWMRSTGLQWELKIYPPWEHTWTQTGEPNGGGVVGGVKVRMILRALVHRGLKKIRTFRFSGVVWPNVRSFHKVPEMHGRSQKPVANYSWSSHNYCITVLKLLYYSTLHLSQCVTSVLAQNGRHQSPRLWWSMRVELLNESFQNEIPLQMRTTSSRIVESLKTKRLPWT